MEEECCPKFSPKPWDGKLHTWKAKKFVKDKVFCLFYVPLNFGGVITKLMKKMEEQEAKSVGWMGLSDHTSPFNMDLYVAVDKQVPGCNNVTMSGKFLTKVYEGDFKETGKWCKNFDKYAKNKGKKYSKMYMWYTTCPKCAKKWGKNYVVIVAKVS